MTARTWRACRSLWTPVTDGSFCCPLLREPCSFAKETRNRSRTTCFGPGRGCSMGPTDSCRREPAPTAYEPNHCPAFSNTHKGMDKGRAGILPAIRRGRDARAPLLSSLHPRPCVIHGPSRERLREMKNAGETPALQAHATVARSGERIRQDGWPDELRRTGKMPAPPP